MGGGAVVGRIDGGGAVELVVGTNVDDVGGWVVGGGSVVAVVV